MSGCADNSAGAGYVQAMAQSKGGSKEIPFLFAAVGLAALISSDQADDPANISVALRLVLQIERVPYRLGRIGAHIYWRLSSEGRMRQTSVATCACNEARRTRYAQLQVNTGT